MWWHSVLDLASDNDWDLRVLWGPHCPWFYREGPWQRLGEDLVHCPTIADTFDTIIAEGQTEVVVVSSYSIVETDLIEGERVHPPGSSAWLAKVEAETRLLLDTARASGARVIIIETIPTLAEAPSECIVGTDDARCDRRLLSEPTAATLTQLFRSLALARPDVDTVNLGELVCPDGVCTYVFDGRLARRDTLHINPDFALAHSTEFAEHLLCLSSSDSPFPDEAVKAAGCP